MWYESRPADGTHSGDGKGEAGPGVSFGAMTPKEHEEAFDPMKPGDRDANPAPDRQVREAARRTHGCTEGSILCYTQIKLRVQRVKRIKILAIDPED